MCSLFPKAILPDFYFTEDISQSLYNWKLPGLSSTIELSSEVIVRCDCLGIYGRKNIFTGHILDSQDAKCCFFIRITKALIRLRELVFLRCTCPKIRFLKLWLIRSLDHRSDIVFCILINREIQCFKETKQFVCLCKITL